MEVTRKMSPISEKPVGASDYLWNNMNTGTLGPTICEWCGTGLPARDGDYTTIEVLGLQVVLECCGDVVDTLYEEWGESFTTQLLKDFAKNALDPRFNLLLSSIRDALQVVKERAQEAINEIEEVEKLL